MNNLNEIVVSFEKEKNNNEIQPTHSEENSYKDIKLMVLRNI